MWAGSRSWSSSGAWRPGHTPTGPHVALARRSASSWPGCCPGLGPHRCTPMLPGRVSTFPELSHGKERGHLLRGAHTGLTPHPSFSLPRLGLGTFGSASPHLMCLPAPQIVYTSKAEVPPPGSLLGLPQPPFSSPICFPSYKSNLPPLRVELLALS